MAPVEEHTHEDPVVEEPTVEMEREDEATMLANLRRKRQEISEDRHLDLEIPGYDGDLVARYVPTEWDEVKKISDKLDKSKNPRKELYAQADILARCCSEILTKIDGELKPLSVAFPELGEEPIRFDDKLCKAMGFEPNSHSIARSAVLGTFNNDIAVSAQHTEVMEWLQSSQRSDDKDF